MTGVTEGKFTRPIGVPVSDEELEKWVVAEQQRSYERRLEAECAWLQADAMLNGFTTFSVNRADRTVWTNPHNPKGSVKVDIPEMITRFRREKGRLLSVLQVPTTAPVVFGDPDIWRTNRFASGACAYIHHNINFDAIADAWVSDLLMSGTSAIMPYWDANMMLGSGDVQLDTGDVNMRIVPGWQMYPLPAEATDDESTSAMVLAYPVSEEWIKQNIPDAINQKTIEFGSAYGLVYGGQWNGRTQRTEGYLLRQVFIKPSRRFPQGEYAVMVGNKVYHRQGRLNFFLGNRRVIPLCPARWCQKNSSWWGESFGFIVSRMNKEINRLASTLLRRAMMKAHPGYLMVPMSATNPEDFKNQIGGVIQYRPSILNPEATRPYWLNYSNSSPDSDVVLNRFSGFMQDITSQHAATEGQHAGRGDSAAFNTGLIRQDMIPNEPTIGSIDRAMKRGFGIGLEIGRAKWQGPKRATIAGPAGIVATDIEIDPRAIPSMENIKIVTGLDMAMDKVTKLDFLGKLATPPFAGGEAQLDREEYRRALMALGVTIEGVDLISEDERTAWAENMIIYGDGITPGVVNDPEPALEALDVHMRTHRKFAATQVLHNASPQVRATLAYHIRVTSELMGGPAMPSGFDAALQAQDAEDLAEMIEAGQASAQFNPGAVRGDAERLIAQMVGGGMG